MAPRFLGSGLQWLAVGLHGLTIRILRTYATEIKPVDFSPNIARHNLDPASNFFFRPRTLSTLAHLKNRIARLDGAWGSAEREGDLIDRSRAPVTPQGSIWIALERLTDEPQEPAILGLRPSCPRRVQLIRPLSRRRFQLGDAVLQSVRPSRC